jgi:hypothetical protein
MNSLSEHSLATMFKQTLTMGAKRNASTISKTAQDSKPMTLKEWICPHCSLTNEEDMSITVFF